MDELVLHGHCMGCDGTVAINASAIVGLRRAGGEKALLLCDGCELLFDEARRAGVDKYSWVGFPLAVSRYYLEMDDDPPEGLFTAIYRSVLAVGEKEDKADWQEMYAETKRLEYEQGY